MIHTARRAEPVNGDRANGNAHDTATEGQDMTDTTSTPPPLDLDLNALVDQMERRANLCTSEVERSILHDGATALRREHAEVEALRTERDRLAAALAERAQWEDEVAGMMHPSWDGDDAQIAILTSFIKHAAALDNVIETAREADDHEGNSLTFIWDDETRTLSAAPSDALAEVKRAAEVRATRGLRCMVCYAPNGAHKMSCYEHNRDDAARGSTRNRHGN